MHQYVIQVYIHNYHTQKEKEYIANIIIIGFGNELKTKYVFFSFNIFFMNCYNYWQEKKMHIMVPKFSNIIRLKELFGNRIVLKTK